MNAKKSEEEMKVNRRLLPIKLHFFLFMAASGAVLPYLQVMGRQLGASEVVMGGVTALLPPLYLLAKPLFGLLVDHFGAQRRLIFLLVLGGQNAAYACLHFVLAADPAPLAPPLCPNATTAAVCANGSSPATQALEPSPTSDAGASLMGEEEEGDAGGGLYSSWAFWAFVALLCVGTVLFNVANSVSDAITFDILGEGHEMSYGEQRVWGTVGFGLSALLSGSAMQMWRHGEDGGVYANYAPALGLAVVFGAADLLVCHCHLQMPRMERSGRILRDVGALVARPSVAVFLLFAAVCGALDGFLIYYLFWFLEEMAERSGEASSVKLLEGLVVAAETLIGETVFFYLSSAILRLLGDAHGRHAHARGLSLALAAFALRCALVSAATSPWHLLPVEALMQGPTYALSYTAIVGYAASVSPPGASATVQGLVAGVDDGLGYALGSLLGGVLYKYLGGARAFQVFAAVAMFSAAAHHTIYECHLKHTLDDHARRTVEYKPAPAAAAAADGGAEEEEAAAAESDDVRDS